MPLLYNALIWGGGLLFAGQAIKSTGQAAGDAVGEAAGDALADALPFLAVGAVIYLATKGQ